MPTETTETYNIFAVGNGGVDPSNLTFQDIVNALGYTPYSNQNPNGYVTNSDVTTSILSYNYVTQTELENALANYQPSGTYVKGIKLNNVQQTVDSTGNVSLTIDHTWGNITGNISDNSALSSALSAKSTVVGTASSNKWTALTIDGVNHTIGGGVTSYNDLTDKPTLATVATSGSYNDLINKPNIPSVISTSQLINDSGFITSAYLLGYATESYVQNYHDSTKQNKSTAYNFDNIVFSDTEPSNPTEGMIWIDESEAETFTVDSVLNSTSTNPVQNKVIYTALQNKANSTHTHTASQITDLATVATTGSYNDLSDTPTIPTIDSALSSTSTNPVQNNVINTALSGKADSEHTHTISQITNFPVLSTVATSGSYNDLSDKPTIPSSDNFVTRDTTQSITGTKHFLNGIGVYSTTQGSTVTRYNHNYISAGGKTLSFPTESGTFALTSDFYNLVSYKNRDLYGRVVDLYYDTDDIQYGLKIENDHDDYVEIGADKIKWYDDDEDAPGTGIYDISFPQKTGTMALTSDIPTNVSALTNDSGFITNTYHDSTKQDVLTAGTGVSINNNVISINGTVYKYKGSCTYSELPSDASEGDVWNVTDAHSTYPAGTNYAWTGSAWDALGGSVDLSAYETSAHASSTYQTIDTAYNRSNIVYSPTEPSNPTIGMIWLQPVS